jgi:sec-independent protein translocase protein TatA
MNFGPWELLIVAAVAFLFFGNRLPAMMRSLGQSVTSFKEGLSNGELDPDSAKLSSKL